MVVNLATGRSFFVFTTGSIKFVDTSNNCRFGLDIKWLVATFAVAAGSVIHLLE